MRQRSFILVAVTVAILIVGAVAAYAYDSSRDDTIAKGVTVAGVDVGGMSVGEAKAKLNHELAGSLQKPVTIDFRKRHFKLTAKRAELRADVDGMANEALQRSRDGTIISRVARDITGGEEDAQVPAEVHYSTAAVSKFVSNVKKSLDRPAQDATLNFPTLTKVKEHDGLTVDEAGLQERVEQAITLPGAGRSATVPVRVKKPKVTRAQLASKYPTLIVVQRDAFRLTLYKKLRQIHSYTIAVGQVGLETPAGIYHIQNKEVNPSWHVPNSAWAGSLAGTTVPPGPDDPIKARWLGIFDGAGIHGTDELYSLGSAASHGCIRMAIP
ncbi:MAG TPA: L,D-transpeptidase/peptidoglycan binding protein, partial [Thermoleophilaceae bacterium]